MKYCFSDTETYSETPIANGTHAYAEDSEVMIWAYAFDDQPVHVWDVTINPHMPEDLRAAIDDPKVQFVFHKSSFDRNVIRHALGIDIPVKRVEDTMVQALAHGLPGALGTLCEIFKIDKELAKDKAGKTLIQLFCKPKSKSHKLRRAISETHPEKWQKFCDYARNDVEAMRQIHKRLPKWNYRGSELTLWRLDQRINERGFQVDTELAQRAIETVKRTQDKLKLRTSEITKGKLFSVSERDKFLLYLLGQYGVDLPNMRASTLEKRLDDNNLPEGVKELLRIRLQVCTTSAAKYNTLLKAVSSDGRLRGTLQFCGASRTGRWSGRTFQPQNLPSKNLPPQEEIEKSIELIRHGVIDLVSEDKIMKMISASLRGCIIAPKGRKLVVSDLSNIEGRVACWLAGEKWKIQAFRDFDKGTGTDLYKLAYAKAFQVEPENVTKSQRQVGKVMELALGYEGGVGAFVTFATVYGINLSELAEKAWPTIPGIIKEETRNMWEWAVERKRTFDMEEKTFKTCDAFKRLWRKAHPQIISYWEELADEVKMAVFNPDKTRKCRKLKIRRDGSWLRIGLPSGRALCYSAPKINQKDITYMGVNQTTHKWSRLKTYGGKLFENVCQAVARDVMASNMPRIENYGYEIILSVHDEIITEVPDNAMYNGAELDRLLAYSPEWAPDLPLVAGGFEALRYRKD